MNAPVSLQHWPSSKRAAFLAQSKACSALAGLAPFLEQASPQAHFLDTAARGVLDLRDLVYFMLLTATGLVLNTVLIERRRLQ